MQINPSLKDKPIGVLQRRYITTTNYVARNMGVPKALGLSTVFEICPTMILVVSEMNRYRRASRMIWDFVENFFRKKQSFVLGDTNVN